MSKDYSQTKEYHLIYAELITAARYQGVITYQYIAKIMGLPLQGNYMGLEVGRILGAISEEEVKNGRPMLSAVAVGVSGEPGGGFYALARQLDYDFDEDKKSQRKFWQGELKEVYNTWKFDL